jgi:phosphoglycolate phosphatase-like HAD superfamily hydrolase
MKSNNLIVFDMDGVLIDVSNSYRDTVRQTAGLFFSLARHAELLPEPLFDLSDLAAVKQSGGLNNDWDLSCQVIGLLRTVVDKSVFSESGDPWSYYRANMSRCDVRRLAAFLKSTQTPLQTLLKQHGKIADPFVDRLYRGDVGSGNVIKQIFQEIYLGKELFTSTYARSPEMCSGDGYILREKVLIELSILEDLSKFNRLAIATGRPEAEAYYPLEHFRLKDYFGSIYTLDDCLREEQSVLEESGQNVSLSKPHPYMLDAIAENISGPINEYYYVGDMPDDMLAAKNSRTGFKGIGILISAADKKSLQRSLTQAGADHIVEDFNALLKILHKHWQPFQSPN